MKPLIKIIKNKYFIATAVVFVWMIFFDKNDVFVQYQYARKVVALEEKRDFYKKEIEQLKKDIDLRQSTPEHLEKFAREKYLMKKDNEDIFVVVETTPKELE